MRRLAALIASVASASIGAADTRMPEEFLGAWAATKSDCERAGRSTLVIGNASVEAYGTTGHVVLTPTALNQVIEVVFERPSGAITGRDVRNFKLSTDGTKLHELHASKVVITRTKCYSVPK